MTLVYNYKIYTKHIVVSSFDMGRLLRYNGLFFDHNLCHWEWGHLPVWWLAVHSCPSRNDIETPIWNKEVGFWRACSCVSATVFESINMHYWILVVRSLCLPFFSQSQHVSAIFISHTATFTRVQYMTKTLLKPDMSFLYGFFDFTGNT